MNWQFTQSYASQVQRVSFDIMVSGRWARLLLIAVIHASTKLFARVISNDGKTGGNVRKQKSSPEQSAPSAPGADCEVAGYIWVSIMDSGVAFEH